MKKANNHLVINLLAERIFSAIKTIYYSKQKKKIDSGQTYRYKHKGSAATVGVEGKRFESFIAVKKH
jgi:hypothetical protein